MEVLTDIKQKLYVFDFDGTISKRDTLGPLSIFFLKKGVYFGFLNYFSSYVLFRLGVFSNEKLKYAFLRSFLKGKKKDVMKEYFTVFFSCNIEINSTVFSVLQRSLKRGDRVIIVSANFTTIIESWVEYMKLENVEIIATVPSYNEVYSGKITGRVCRGVEKSKRLKEIIDHAEYFITSYADEPSDMDIMKLANKKYWVGKYQGEE